MFPSSPWRWEPLISRTTFFVVTYLSFLWTQSKHSSCYSNCMHIIFAHIFFLTATPKTLKETVYLTLLSYASKHSMCVCDHIRCEVTFLRHVKDGHLVLFGWQMGWSGGAKVTLLSCLELQWRWLEGCAHLRLSSAVLSHKLRLYYVHGSTRFQEQMLHERNGKTFMT